MAATTTIRVPVEVRDRLALVAESRGVSVPKLLAEFATTEHIHQIYDEERRAWSEALERPAFVAELELWDEDASDVIE